MKYFLTGYYRSTILLIASILEICDTILFFYQIIIAIKVGTAEANFRSTAWIEGFALFLAVVISTITENIIRGEFITTKNITESFTVIRDKQE
jgi:hypothetical protein